MFDLSPGLISIFIPILAVIGIFAMIIVVIIMSNREKELKHKERLLAMEKGMELPEEPIKQKRPAYLSLRAWGLVLFSLGAVLFFALWVQVGFKYSIWGLMPAGLGVGLMIAAAKERKDIMK
jgi:hypothetical protein